MIMEPPRSIKIFSYSMIAIMFISSFFMMTSVTVAALFLYMYFGDVRWFDETVQSCSEKWNI